MSIKTTSTRRFPPFATSLVLTIAALTSGGSSFAQPSSEPSFVEKARLYRDKIVASMESTARSAGEQYGKLKAEAAKASGPAREKLAAEMEVMSKKWAVAREKLTTSLDAHLHSVGQEIKTLEARAANATGAAREKSAAEMEKLRAEWNVAREKVGASLSSNMKAAGEEFSHLKQLTANASVGAKEKLAPRMEQLKAEWSKNRDKLATYLESDLKATKDEIDKLGAETSNAARTARDKLLKKYQDLKAQHSALANDRSIDASK